MNGYKVYGSGSVYYTVTGCKVAYVCYNEYVVGTGKSGDMASDSGKCMTREYKSCCVYYTGVSRK